MKKQSCGNQLIRREKEKLIAKLNDSSFDFCEQELQAIIDNEFYNDHIEMDVVLIDAAARRLAQMHGISSEKQYTEIAHAALRHILQKAKLPTK